MFGPHLAMPKGVLGHPGRNNNESLHKTVDMCIFLLLGGLQHHLASIFANNCRRGKPSDNIRNFEEKKLLRCFVDTFSGRGRTSARGLLREFSISSDIKCFAGQAWGDLPIKSDFDFWDWLITLVLKYLDIFDVLEKVASGPQLFLDFLFVLNTKFILQES